MEQIVGCDTGVMPQNSAVVFLRTSIPQQRHAPGRCTRPCIAACRTLLPPSTSCHRPGRGWYTNARASTSSQARLSSEMGQSNSTSR